MDPDEILPHRIERNQVGVVLEPLREDVSDPGEPPHVHPRIEVLTLDVGHRSVGEVGCSPPHPSSPHALAHACHLALREIGTGEQRGQALRISN